MVTQNLEKVQQAIAAKREDTIKVRAALQEKASMMAMAQQREMGKLDNIAQ